MKRELALFTLAVEIVALTAGGYWLGGLADDYFKTAPLLAALVPLIGLVGWTIHVVILARSLEKP